jgi:exosortase/archaeosortase family protein
LLNLGGYDSYYTIGKKLGETYIFLNDDILPTVRIGAACNGLEMLVIFSFFIAWYPGNKYVKLGFIGAGLLLIHSLNILRNFVLTILAINRSIYFELFHRYIFIFLIYGTIFILWMIWANYLSKYKIKYES